MAAQLLTASVVVEWYNLNYAELDRAVRMLAELASQSNALQTAYVGAPVRLAEPLELVIAFDADRLDIEQVRSVVGDSMRAADLLTVRFLPVADSTYCKLKNAGASISHGDIVIFLDSDVIPEPGWLSAMLTAFVNPGVSVVVGNTYVDYSDSRTYSKTMALTWMFPLRDATDELTVSSWFYANNVAFRRDTFLSRQFPDVPGLIHAPARLLVERLRRDSVTIWHAAGARASHPPPNGAVHFMMRALSAGRARVFFERPTTFESMLKWLRQDARSIAHGSKEIVRSGSRVQLRWWEVLPAVAITAAYYASVQVGTLLSIAFPQFMQDRFRL